MTIIDSAPTVTPEALQTFTKEAVRLSHEVQYRRLDWSARSLAIVVADEIGIVSAFHFSTLPYDDRQRLIEVATGALVANGTKV